MAKVASFRVNVSVEPDETASEPWNGVGIAGRLLKSDDERRFTLAVAYPVNKPDVGIARDGHRDFAGIRAVEQAAWDYLIKSREVGAWHADGTEGAGQVVENFVWPESAPDWTVTAIDGTDQVIKPGDWLIGIRWDAAAWQAIKEGRASGVSMQGSAKRRTPDAEALAQLRT